MVKVIDPFVEPFLIWLGGEGVGLLENIHFCIDYGQHNVELGVLEAGSGFLG